LLPMLLVSYNSISAQQNGKLVAFKSGNEYLKLTTVNSASILQRGNVIINVNSTSFVSKTYKIDAVNNNGFAVTMVTNKITDTIRSGDNHFYFNSDQPDNTSDKLANALQYTVGKSAKFNVFNNGTISSVDMNASKLVNDTLFTFTGIETEDLSAGKRFAMIADITSYSKLKPGDNWADTLGATNNKTITKFWLVRRTPVSTTFGYSSSTKGDKLNTNSNGTYVVNNTTGIITSRLIQSVTVGYQIYKRTVYSSTRRTNVAESCYTVH